jgi:hypothetical protein
MRLLTVLFLVAEYLQLCALSAATALDHKTPDGKDPKGVPGDITPRGGGSAICSHVVICSTECQTQLAAETREAIVAAAGTLMIYIACIVGIWCILFGLAHMYQIYMMRALKRLVSDSIGQETRSVGR